MNKKEFLEKLSQKLRILNKEEVADIISEYSGYIDNKISEGKSEEEAVADFGNVNDLAKEILSAYKLSEDYIPGDEFTSSKFFDDTASILNKSIAFTTRFFKDIFNHTNASYIVNILVTLFVALILVAILKIPFMVIEHLGRGFIQFVFPPVLYGFLSFIWMMFVNIIYLVVVIFIFVSLLKSGFGKNIDFIKNSIKNATDRKKEYRENYGKDWRKHYHWHCSSDSSDAPASEMPASEMPASEMPASEASINEGRPSQSDNESGVSQRKTANNPFSLLLKILINILAVILLLPLFPSVIVLGITAGVLVYLLTQGISIYGLTFLVVGLFFLFTSLISMVFSIVYKHGRKLRSHIAGFLIASVMIGFGGVYSFFEFMNYDYIDTVPKTLEFNAHKNYSYDITTDQIIINANNAILKYVVDNTLENRIALDVKYNDLYNEIYINSNIRNQSGNNSFSNNNNGGRRSAQIIVINHSTKMARHGLISEKEIIKNVIDGLKDKKIYNIRNIFVPEITVYVNEAFIRNVSGTYGDSYGMPSLTLERRSFTD